MEGRTFVTTTNRPLAVALFQEEAQAKQAMKDLLRAGFTDDQIRYSVHKGGTGILDALMGLGLTEQEANYYNREFEAGRTIVTVNTPDRQQEAYDILSRNGGYNANAGYGQTGQTAYAGQTAYSDQMGDTGTGEKVQLREEQLQVGKQPVQTGEVGLRKEVVSEQQTIDVPVTHEEVVVERRPGSGQPTDTPIGEGETYRVPVREEQVTVDKQPVVREEVSLGKRKVQDKQEVSDTVRREEARIEREGDVDVQDTDTDLKGQ